MKKNKLIILQIFIVLALICTSVYAAVDTTISLSASSTEVKRGEEVIITLSLKNVDANKKVQSIEGYINYNKNVLEKVTVDSIVKSNENTVKIGDEELPVEDLTNKTEPNASDYCVAFNGTPATDNDVKIIIDLRNGIDKDTEILKIKFKVKENATLQTVTDAISYEMFEITAGNETVGDITKNVSLTVVSSNTQDPNQNEQKPDDQKPENEPEEKPENKQEEPKNEPAKDNKNTNKNNNNTNKNNNNTNKANTNKNTNTKNTNTNSKDDTVAGTNLPATGAKVIVLPAIVLIILAYVSYNKYMKYKDI